MKVRRAAIDDANDLLAWRNDPEARAMFKTTEVVEIASHMAWLTGALHNPNSLILIGEHAGRKVGVVRFGRTGQSWEVSINVAAQHRGVGHGASFLRMSLDVLHRIHGSCVVSATVRKRNCRSIRVFTRCGFCVSGRDEDFLYMQRS